VRVLGIDPGTAILGWGVVEIQGVRATALDYGAVQTAKSLAAADRLAVIYSALQEIVARWQPEAAAVEKLYFGQNTRTALDVGQARGVALLVLAQNHLPMVELTPAEVKQAITGYGRADKSQMQRMVQRLLGLEAIPKPDDAADALAIALSGHDRHRMRDRWAP